MHCIITQLALPALWPLAAVLACNIKLFYPMASQEDLASNDSQSAVGIGPTCTSTLQVIDTCLDTLLTKCIKAQKRKASKLINCNYMACSTCLACLVAMGCRACLLNHIFLNTLTPVPTLALIAPDLVVSGANVGGAHFFEIDIK